MSMVNNRNSLCNLNYLPDMTTLHCIHTITLAKATCKNPAVESKSLSLSEIIINFYVDTSKTSLQDQQNYCYDSLLDPDICDLLDSMT